MHSQGGASGQANLPVKQICGGCFLLGAMVVVAMQSGVATDQASSEIEIAPGVTTAAAIRGAKANAKSKMVMRGTDDEDGHWVQVKGADGKMYTQWQGPGDAPSMPGSSPI
eukprot:SAG11_NODE_1486_length_4819_cov_1.894280_6_plen_111_part_00